MATSGSAGKNEFNPENYVENRGGSQYLPLKWQLAWLRKDHPKAELSTNLVSHDNGIIVFQAQIKLPEGGSATGWGVKAAGEDSPGDLSHYTAAENQALSRALASLGYGIEYANDFDPPSENLSILLPNEPGLENLDNEEEPSIEVPMNEIEVKPSLTIAEPAPWEAAPADEPEEDEEEEEEDEAPPPPPKISELRPPAYRETARPTPATPRKAPEPPAPTPVRPVPVPSGAPQIVNTAIEDRLKNVQDSTLRLTIKQIYNTARTRHNIGENSVDKRSEDRFGKPTYELTLEEAEEYLEAIRTSRPRSTNK